MSRLFRSIAQALNSGAKPRFDAAWSDLIDRGQTRLSLARDPVSKRDLPGIFDAVRACPSHPAFTTFWKGPEALGIPIELVLDNGVSANETMLHFATIIWQSLVHDLGLHNCYGGFLTPPTGDRIQLAIWVHGQDTRTLFVPVLQATGDTISVALAHVVWWRQPWMDSHPDTHWWWANLSSQYSEHFEAEGGIYSDAFAALAQNKARFYKGVLGGIQFDAIQGQPVFRDPQFKSFYHFQIGSDVFPTGSEPGMQFRAIRLRLMQLVAFWRHQYVHGAVNAEQPPRPETSSYHKPANPRF